MENYEILGYQYQMVGAGRNGSNQQSNNRLVLNVIQSSY